MGARFSAPVQTGPGAQPASYTMGTGSFPGVKRPGRGVDHPPPARAEGKERVELYLYFPSGLSWPVLGRALPLPLSTRCIDVFLVILTVNITCVTIRHSPICLYNGYKQCSLWGTNWISVLTENSSVVQWGHATARTVSHEFDSGSARVRCLTKWHCERLRSPKIQFSPVSIIPPILPTDLILKLLLSEEKRTKPGNPQIKQRSWRCRGALERKLFVRFFSTDSLLREWDPHQEFPHLHTFSLAILQACIFRWPWSQV